jgi:hypothetical protein
LQQRILDYTLSTPADRSVGPHSVLFTRKLDSLHGTW